MIPRGCVVSGSYSSKTCDSKSRRMPGSSSYVTNGNLFRKRNRFTGTTPSEDDTFQEEGPSLDASGTRSSISTSKSRKRRDSSISSLSELTSNIRRRSASLRGPQSPKADTVASSRSQDTQSGSTISSRPTYTTHNSSTFATRQASAASSENLNDPKFYRPSSAASVRPIRGLTSFSVRRDEPSRPSTALQGGYGQMADGPNQLIQSSGGATNPTITSQKIHDVASKRISTLDYLRKTHENQVYWYNTLLYTKADLLKLPYFDLTKLSRRASSYLLLGLSIPAVLDPNSNTLVDYLRTFSSLLADFEAYQTAHPPDGSSHSSLSKMRVPGMFKRVPQISNSKSRRGSAADTFTSPTISDSPDFRSFSGGNISAASAASITALAAADRELLAGEEYQYLLTPSIPFDPDYFETFATLCDVMIDCYTSIIDLSSSPDTCGPVVGDMFAKVDSKVRKILVAGIVRDFEDATKQGVRAEMAGVGKVVLGGLM